MNQMKNKDFIIPHNTFNKVRIGTYYNLTYTNALEILDDAIEEINFTIRKFPEYAATKGKNCVNLKADLQILLRKHREI